MARQGAKDAARALVGERFPDARAAWLAGGVVTGAATATSDLDITVLLAGPPAPFRESLTYAGWPVELFVHTFDTLEHWLAKDRQRRRPTLGRLVGAAVPLLDVDGVGVEVAERCRAFLAAGPEPLTDADRDAIRYGLTDLLDDLVDATDPAAAGAAPRSGWRSNSRRTTPPLLLEVVDEILAGSGGRLWVGYRAGG